MGCSDDETEPGGPVPVRIESGDYAVRVSADAVDLLRRDDVLLSFPADAFVLGRVDEIDDATNYDPYPLVTGAPTATEPPGLSWQPAEKIRPTARDATSVTVTLTHSGGRTSTLSLSVDGDGRFGARFVPSAEGDAIAYLRLRPRVDGSEGFYGLGEVFDDVNHRGKVRAMQLEATGELESTNNEAHVPIPLLVGTRGWGLFVENPYPAAFDVAQGDAEHAEITFGTGAASGEGLSFHLLAAEHPLDVTRRYYDATGYPRLPARWALGPWVWRDENDDQAQVENDLAQIRALDLATSAYWIDRPYATAVNTFDFNPTQFPDAQAMIDKMHALGFRTALWHTPYLDEKDPATQALRDEATQKGYYPPERGLLLNKWGPPIDFTNPDAVAWWKSLVKKYIDMGVEGFKLDYGEDIVPGVFGARNVWKFSDGSDERTMHSQFQKLYHSTYSELLGDEQNFLLCRGGTYGDQTHVSVIWPGDLDASFAKHGETVDTGTDKYNAVGGLPASVVAGLSLGPSGYPFYGSDTGGYRHSPPDKELFTRWFEQTALSSVMQIGTSSNDVAWEATAENGFDDEMLGWYRKYVRLHLRLFPYEWTLAKRIAEDGRPIQRALGLAYPELGIHPNDVYLFGDDLLVAPVVERGVTSREVPLPPGTWVDYWTGVAHEGPGTLTVDAPLDTLPLFLRAGGIVPMLRPTIDTLAPTTDTANVDSFATTPGLLWVRIAPGAASSFALYDGTELTQAADSSEISLGTKGGAEFSLGTVFEVIGLGTKPASVTVDGQPLSEAADLDAAAEGYSYTDETGGTLWVKLGPGERAVTVTR